MERVGCQNCSEWVTEELTPRNICPRHHQPSLFVTTQWTSGQTWYVGYRWLVALSLVAWVLYDYYMETALFYEPQYELWFVFATDWAFLALLARALFHALLIACYHSARQTPQPRCQIGCCCGAPVDDTESKLPTKYQLFWVLYTIAASTGLDISLSYWTFWLTLSTEEVFLTTASKVKHTVNSVLILMDLMIDGVPIRLLHVVYPLLCGVLYVIFTGFYYLTGGSGAGPAPAIYPMLDWHFPGEAVLTISIEFLFTILMHCVVYAIYRLRLLLEVCCRKKETGSASQLVPEEGETERQELVNSDKQAPNQGYSSMDFEER